MALSLAQATVELKSEAERAALHAELWRMRYFLARREAERAGLSLWLLVPCALLNAGAGYVLGAMGG